MRIFTHTMFLLIYLFQATLFADATKTPIQKELSLQNNILDSKGNVTDLIIEFLSLTGIYIKDSPSGDGSQQLLRINSPKLKEVVMATQGKINPQVTWKMEGKRWEMHNPLLTSETAKQVLELGLKNFGFDHPVFPQAKEYEGMVLLGATAGRFYERVLFADKLSKEGLNFKTVYILTGKRPLELFEKEQFPFLRNINDEGKMTLAIFKKIANPLLQGNYVYIYSDPPTNSPRATTESTIHAWMKHNPKPGKYLLVSNSYYIPYQELVVQNCINKSYPHADIQVECVGPEGKVSIEGASENKLINQASIFLDNLSRILYNLQIKKEIKETH